MSETEEQRELQAEKDLYAWLSALKGAGATLLLPGCVTKDEVERLDGDETERVDGTWYVTWYDWWNGLREQFEVLRRKGYPFLVESNLVLLAAHRQEVVGLAIFDRDLGSPRITGRDPEERRQSLAEFERRRERVRVLEEMLRDPMALLAQPLEDDHEKE